MIHSSLVGWGLGAAVIGVVIWLLDRVFGATISNVISGVFELSPEEQRLDEWRTEVRNNANSLGHVWRTNDITESHERETIQTEFKSTIGELDNLLARSPSLAGKEEKRMVREVVEAGDGFADQEIKTMWAPVNFGNPDPEVTTVGKDEDEIQRDFEAQGEDIVSAADELKEDIEDKQNSGLLPF